MENKETVCAVVVTYNRKNLLIECLEALRKQTRPIQGIYLIDNASTDGTPELLFKEGYITELPPKDLSEPWEKDFQIRNFTDGDIIRFHYVRMHENTGGAGGFYEGVKRGYERGYDWLWLMDDDVEPYNDTLENLLIVKIPDNRVVALASVRLHNNIMVKYETKKFDFDNLFKYFTYDNISEQDLSKPFFRISAIPFEGPLISRYAIEQIGYPLKDLFIFADDTDYAIRLMQVGNIYMVSSSKLNKKIISDGNLFNWKSYYLLRNIIYLDVQYGHNILIKKLRPYITMLRFLRLYRRHLNLTKIKIIIRAVYDGMNMNLGKNIMPGEF